VRAILTEGRLGAGPARALVDHVNAVELGDELDAVDEFVLIDIAHALTLTRQGVFELEHGRSLVTALLKLLDHEPRELLAGDPEIGTITLQLERYLEDECGPAGLDIQRARSRIDQKATGVRMADRGALLLVMTETLRLAETLLHVAEEYDEVIVPGYTHLQHAQPTSLGHYFNAHYWSTSRSLSRMAQAYERLNECPLGGAAHSGTAWPIDRRATAEYLGFSRPVRNARDAGLAAMDTTAELAGVLGLTLAGVGRCASDLYYWSSSEVGMVRLHPSLCGTSSMMPQKRNPIVLERIRGLAGDAAGWGASRLGVLHFATSTDADQGYVHNRISRVLPGDRGRHRPAPGVGGHARDRRGAAGAVRGPVLVYSKCTGRRPGQHARHELPRGPRGRRSLHRRARGGGRARRQRAAGIRRRTIAAVLHRSAGGRLGRAVVRGEQNQRRRHSRRPSPGTRGRGGGRHRRAPKDCGRADRRRRAGQAPSAR
jgi:argininosuccinate lyase